MRTRLMDRVPNKQEGRAMRRPFFRAAGQMLLSSARSLRKIRSWGRMTIPKRWPPGDEGKFRLPDIAAKPALRHFPNDGSNAAVLLRGLPDRIRGNTVAAYVAKIHFSRMATRVLAIAMSS
jgi:hypothetical protein